MPRYLTKSRFKLALECETKLFYTKKEEEYADQSFDDSFMKSLAEGGFQVGELAKYYFCDDPIAAGLTVETIKYEEALPETQKRIDDGVTVIAEAAFRFENLFIRTDIFQIFQEQKVINLFEVKAKSYSSTDRFFSYKRNSDAPIGINSKWKSYLYDVAFQKYVLFKLYPGFKINSFLMMANKDTVATVDGLNQFFKIVKTGDRGSVEVKNGLNRSQLGEEILIRVPVDEEVKWIWENPVDTEVANNINFKDYINLLSEKYDADEKMNVPIGTRCKKCQFKTTSEQDKIGKLKNGFKECWLAETGLSASELKKPLVLDLWAQYFRGMQGLIDSGVYLLESVTKDMLISNAENNTEYIGLSPLERRLLQIEKSRNKDKTVYLDLPCLKIEMDSWTYPLHFIDFETSRVAIPFHVNRRPYEQIAFQFSHHIVNDDHTIIHKGQYISFEPGEFPNYNFVRALKKELEKDNGTIFRYHNHENTVLNDIYDQLNTDTDVIPDRDELLTFIKSITHRQNKNGKEIGERDMVDLYKLVTSYYYPPAAGGSNSLKYILPATIQASKYLQNKYGQPIYGTPKMPSLNFINKTWLESSDHFNPYKSLPAVFDDVDADQLDSVVEGFDEVAEGGAAMTAYAKLQFGHVPMEQRQMLRDALLKYCELDTLAMVMIWEAWVELLAE
ncbi:MAG: DUF2779 domain-containing protein [Bacteroidota bacterium]